MCKVVQSLVLRWTEQSTVDEEFKNVRCGGGKIFRFCGPWPRAARRDGLGLALCYFWATDSDTWKEQSEWHGSRIVQSLTECRNWMIPKLWDSNSKILVTVYQVMQTVIYIGNQKIGDRENNGYCSIIFRVDDAAVTTSCLVLGKFTDISVALKYSRPVHQ